MTTELQNKVWKILPKEFKEEVKKYYQRVCRYDNLYSARGATEALELLFGKHNLTSDAEGEEMLCCEKSKVRTMYDNAADMIVGNQLDSEAAQMAMLTKGLFEELFGTKCLSDEEPKFKSGDLALYLNKSIVRIVEYRPEQQKYYVHRSLDNLKFPADESDLEPYTEPEASTCTQTCTDDCPSQSKSQYLNLSQSMSKCDKYDDNTLTDRENNRQDHIGENSEMVDSIIKDSFRNHNRLHIAALAMQGLLFDGMRDPDTVAEVAFEYADALIRKSKKGGDDGKD